MDPRQVLEQFFGYTDFRPGQRELIDGILSGRDVFGVMPTGGGKSLCYQVPALMLGGITLVVSPLVSLMQDQVLALKAAGITAAYINSSLNYQQIRVVYRNLLEGHYKIIYVAPERLDLESFSTAAERIPISLVAVDEAHCISQWGQDFRPSYLRILNFIDGLPRRPIVAAFTATATAQVQVDILRILKLRDPVRMVTGFDRPNLSFDVLRPRSKNDELLQLLASRQNKSGIIYCSTRKNVENVHETLCDHGFQATRYHAGLSDEERSENQEAFIRDQKTIMVATNAFGMGIDKSNVNFVIHYNMPRSMEAYYQEAGRAGRDGTDAECILLFADSDIHTARYMINNPSENEELDEAQRELIRQQDIQRLETMIRYCRTDDCLRGAILDYFGQVHPRICGNCGNCIGTFEQVDISREAQMILSCVKRMHDKLGYWMGIVTVARVLSGSRDKRVLELGLQELSTYGLMRHIGRNKIKEMAAVLEAEGYLKTDPETSGLMLMNTAADVLFRGKQVLWLVRKEVEEAAPTSKTAAMSEDDTELFDLLKKLRARLAAKASMAPYMVFSNATLQEIARKKPRNRTDFRKISGVGEIKTAWYAQDFLEVINQYLSER